MGTRRPQRSAVATQTPIKQDQRLTSKGISDCLESVRRELPPRSDDSLGYTVVSMETATVNQHPWLAGLDAAQTIPVLRARVCELLVHPQHVHQQELS